MTRDRITSILQKTWAYSAKEVFELGKLYKNCRVRIAKDTSGHCEENIVSVFAVTGNHEKLGDLPQSDALKFLKATSSGNSSVECIITKLVPIKNDFVIEVDIIIENKLPIVESVINQPLFLQEKGISSPLSTQYEDNSFPHSYGELQDNSITTRDDIGATSTYGFVYVIDNPSIHGLVKVGFTLRHPRERAKELASTGVPTPYEVVYYASVDNPQKIETNVHRRLSPYNAGKEWFTANITECITAIRAESPDIENEFFSSKVPLTVLSDREMRVRKKLFELEARLEKEKTAHEDMLRQQLIKYEEELWEHRVQHENELREQRVHHEARLKQNLSGYEAKLQEEKEKEERLVRLRAQLRKYQEQKENLDNSSTSQDEYVKEKSWETTHAAFVIAGVLAVIVCIVYRDTNFDRLLWPILFLVFLPTMGVSMWINNKNSDKWKKEFQDIHQCEDNTDMKNKLNIAIQQTNDAIEKLES